MRDGKPGHWKGYGFITFSDLEFAKKALEQLNGFELAGRPMKVGDVTEWMDAASAGSSLDSDELERTRVDLGTTGHLQLMARLAEGTCWQVPPAAQALGMMILWHSALWQICEQDFPRRLNQLPLQPLPPLFSHLQRSVSSSLSMFNPQAEEKVRWDTEIKDV